jgi:glycogen phosphorylase
LAGRLRWRWVPETVVKGIPYDTPIPGYRTITVNGLRLWKAEAVDSFDLEAFDTGDYMGAVREKMQSETVSKVLYPSDDKDQGKRLRLQQQYFFTSCSLQDMIRIHLQQQRPLEDFNQKWSVRMTLILPLASLS